GTSIPQLDRFTFAGLQSKLSTLSTPANPSQPAPSTTQTSPTPPPAVGELGGSDSGKIRLFVWEGALAIFRAHPLFGTGVETYAFAYYLYRPAGHNLTSEW